MNVRQISASERERFNEFCAHGPKSHILQAYEWGEIKSHTGWEPIRLVLEDGDEIVAAMTILKRRIPGLGRTIFYAPRGPIADLTDRRAMQALLDGVRGAARRHRAIFLKIDPDIPATDEAAVAALRAYGFRANARGANFEGVQPRFVMRLDLAKSLEDLLAGMHQKWRYNIRLAERKGVGIRIASRADLRPWYDVLLETAARDRFLVRSYGYFEQLWDYLVERGYARLFLAEYDGRIIAGTLAFLFGDKCWYIYGASSNEHRNVMPNYLLQWEMIKWAKESGCAIYDFRGVSGDLSPDNPLYGLYRFKQGFGAKLVEFVGEYDLIFDPLMHWLWGVGEPAYRRLRGRLRGMRSGSHAAKKEEQLGSPE
ncbi:MAG: lipid II:glycine glycyltransferase FemX [Chloroflexota bacterium]